MLQNLVILTHPALSESSRKLLALLLASSENYHPWAILSEFIIFVLDLLTVPFQSLQNTRKLTGQLPHSIQDILRCLKERMSYNSILIQENPGHVLNKEHALLFILVVVALNSNNDF